MVRIQFPRRPQNNLWNLPGSCASLQATLPPTIDHCPVKAHCPVVACRSEWCPQSTVYGLFCFLLGPGLDALTHAVSLAQVTMGGEGYRPAVPLAWSNCWLLACTSAGWRTYIVLPRSLPSFHRCVYAAAVVGLTNKLTHTNSSLLHSCYYHNGCPFDLHSPQACRCSKHSQRNRIYLGLAKVQRYRPFFWHS